MNEIPALEARALTKRFGGLTAIDSFSVCLRPGEIVGLIGPNGAGKTTAFNLLTSVYRPDAGLVTVGGADCLGLTPDEVTALGVARTFQNIRLFRELSALDNVKVGCTVRSRVGIWATLLRTPSAREAEERVEGEARRLLALVGLQDFAERPAHSLPYGQQRRLEIARALATQPKVLLLDEPAAGANDSESAALQDLIRQIRERFALSILVIEHHMPFVMGLASRLLVLDHGQTIAAGTPAEVQQDPQVIEAYLGREQHA